jgi:hypothetical protein
MLRSRQRLNGFILIPYLVQAGRRNTQLLTHPLLVFMACAWLVGLIQGQTVQSNPQLLAYQRYTVPAGKQIPIQGTSHDLNKERLHRLIISKLSHQCTQNRDINIALVE